MNMLLCWTIAILMVKEFDSVRIVHSGNRNHLKWHHERLSERHNDQAGPEHLSLVEASNNHFIFVKGSEHFAATSNQEKNQLNSKSQIKDVGIKNNTVAKQNKYKKVGKIDEDNVNGASTFTITDSSDTKTSNTSNFTKYTTFVAPLNTLPSRDWEIIERRSIPFHKNSEIELLNPLSVPIFDPRQIEVFNPSSVQYLESQNFKFQQINERP